MEQRINIITTIALLAIFLVFPFGGYLSDKVFGLILGAALFLSGNVILKFARIHKWNYLRYVGVVWCAGAISNLIDEIIGSAHLFEVQEPIIFILITLTLLKIERRDITETK
jgi:dipeptide/tripeptide permease